MSNYVPHYTKKKQILKRKEAGLRRLVDANAPQGKLIDGAMEVRDARVRTLRARRATISPKDDAKLQFAKIDDQIQTILDTPVSLILAEFDYAVDADES